ncbi:MAG TPA: ABC transporter permease [Candidatus Acidoferrum sp.]|nr:ABC transporter permease [Candidatus Acidoferrum sp.]
MKLMTAAFEWQSRAVVGRHLRVYLKNWHTSFLPPVMEPITLLLAFGLGLGAYMSGGIEWNGRRLGYMDFVAPGMLAYATFITSILQSLFGAFVRMRYQRTWDGQLTTQIELRHVVWGEILWSAVLTTSYVVIVALVLSGCQVLGLIHLELARLPIAIPIVFVSACAFAALGLYFTAVSPTIDHINLPLFLVVLPMGFVSSTYFPLTHPVVATISTVNPLYHLAEGLRDLLLGPGPGAHLAGLAVLVTLMLGVLVPLDMRLLRKRVLGD